MGCEVVAFSDSREAVHLVEIQKLDGVFLDATMPNVDGFQLTQQIRQSKSNSRIPIVMLTGKDDAETMRRGFKAGISFFLGKPITKERLEKLFMVMRGPIMSEKRRYIRLPFHTTVTCEWGKKSVKLESRNISLGGMLLEPIAGLDVGTEIDLEFNLPQVQEPLHVRAQAQHIHAHDGIGVQFQGLSAEDRETIENYITGAM
jgi:CheY-like chemotaxis protein